LHDALPISLAVSGAPDIAAALPVLAARFAGFVAITGGAAGCFWMENGIARQALPPPVRAVDTLAAGDVFHGAFTLTIAEGRAIADAIAFANTAAALKCTSFGGRLGTPARAEVDAWLSRNPPIAEGPQPGEARPRP